MVIELHKGSPSDKALKSAAKIIQNATDERLKSAADGVEFLAYGDNDGDELYLTNLAEFLSQQYGSPVDRCTLAQTAGATSGLHMLLTCVFPDKCTVYVERYSYWLAIDIFKMLHFNIVPVDMDQDGLIVDDLVNKLGDDDRSHDDFTAIVYTVPTFHNPTGQSMHSDRARQLVRVAREHRLLVICDDVYNLLQYTDDAPPTRLFAYDNMDDEDYVGNVVSNGSFCKYLAPAVRCGWMEMPLKMKEKYWTNNNLIFSGGALSHYMCGVLGVALQNGSITAHLDELRRDLRSSMNAALNAVQLHMPSGSSFTKPTGGYFIWLTFPPEVDTLVLRRECQEKDGVDFQPGAQFDATSVKLSSSLRISISRHTEREIVEAIKKICDRARVIINQNK